MADEPVPLPPDGQILIYTDGGLHLQVRLDGQTVWLTQRLIADLFDVSVKTANEHLVNIYDEGELPAEATIRKFRIVQTEGSRQVARLVDHYNLDAIVAVGMRTVAWGESNGDRWRLRSSISAKSASSADEDSIRRFRRFP